MGASVLAQVHDVPGLRVVSAVDREGSPAAGTSVAGGVVVSADLEAGLAQARVYIDFTTPVATAAAARVAARHRVAAVIGTTGLDGAARAAIDDLARVAPVLVAPNFSLGVNLLLALAEQAARALGPDWDLEIVETHHRAKRDAPSGTALALAESLARGRGQKLAEVQCLTRAGDIGPRPEGQIGVMTLRGGSVVGDHTAHFLGPGERIALAHHAESRDIFARGALHAARWLVDRPPGHHHMRDVLGL
jgi:4-hydroxy-tetrahydrodipicolinate reductase